MIKFKAKRNDEGKIVKIEIRDHAGYAEEGFDIVCAAVSTACEMAIMGIERMKLAKIGYVQDDGFLSCDISPEREAGADALLESLVIVICEIAEQYKKYLLILEV